MTCGRRLGGRRLTDWAQIGGRHVRLAVTTAGGTALVAGLTGLSAEAGVLLFLLLLSFRPTVGHQRRAQLGQVGRVRVAQRVLALVGHLLLLSVLASCCGTTIWLAAYELVAVGELRATQTTWTLVELGPKRGPTVVRVAAQRLGSGTFFQLSSFANHQRRARRRARRARGRPGGRGTRTARKGRYVFRVGSLRGLLL